MKHRLFLSAIIVFLFSISLFAQNNDAAATEPEVTVITINNARQTSYKKNEDTDNDTIVLEGSVSLSVQKGNSSYTLP